MKQETSSPLVTHLSWGRLQVEGWDGQFKDAKLFPGGAREWDWSETGTSHEPGIQPADVEELLDRGRPWWCSPKASGNGCRFVGKHCESLRRGKFPCTWNRPGRRFGSTTSLAKRMRR
jgi:hypothetical protein